MKLAFGGKQVETLRTGYRVDVDPQTGTGTLRLAGPALEGRNNLAPALTLCYSSGAGNSPFGAGWNLRGLQAVALDTGFHVPR